MQNSAPVSPYLSRATSVTATCLFLAFSSCSTPVNSPPGSIGKPNAAIPDPTMVAEQKRLVSALPTESKGVNRQIVKRLQKLGPLDPEVVCTLIRLRHDKWNDFVQFDDDLLKTIACAAISATPHLVAVLKEQSADTDIVDAVLIAIARMGTAVKCVYPDLTIQLKQLIIENSSKLMLKITLACIGDVSGDEIASIREALKKNERGLKSLFRAVRYIGPFYWDNGDTENALSEYFVNWVNNELSRFTEGIKEAQQVDDVGYPESEYPIRALLALVSMGPKGAHAKAITESTLEEILLFALQSPYAGAGITIGYSLASIKKKDAEAIIRQVVTSHYFGRSDHSDWDALYCVSNANLNQRVVKILRNIIMSDDWEAIPGAISHLADIDDSPQDLVPRLMDIVEGRAVFKVNGKRLEELSDDKRLEALSGRDWCRSYAIYMIGMCGDKSLLPRLEKILESNTSISREWLEEAIKEIKVRPW